MEGRKGWAKLRHPRRLYVPKDLNLNKFYDRLNTVWWIAALIRLRCCSALRITVVASHSFAAISKMSEEPELHPIEIGPRQLRVEEKPENVLSAEALGWVRDYWYPAGRLAHESEDFNLAFRAYDSCIWAPDIALALVSVWGALERLFSPARTELRFRVSANIAGFLEPAGPGRLALFKRTQKLYDARSKAAHGGERNNVGEFWETCHLMRRVLVKMIEQNHVPAREELDGNLFGQ